MYHSDSDFPTKNPTLGLRSVYQSDSDYPTKNPTLDLRSVYQSDSLLIGAASFLRNPTHAEAAHPYFQLLLFSTFSMQAPAFNTPYFPSFSSFPLLQLFHTCRQLGKPSFKKKYGFMKVFHKRGEGVCSFSYSYSEI